MAKPFSLTTYQAMSRRHRSAPQDMLDARPEGKIIWLHCAEQKRLKTVKDLAQRLTAQLGANILVTLPTGVPAGDRLLDLAYCQPVPSEHPDDVAAFLNHWAPDVAVWVGDELRANLVQATKIRNVPISLLEAKDPALSQTPPKWLPSPRRAVLQMFDQIFARTPEAADALRKLTKGQLPVTSTGQLVEETEVLTCNSDDLESLSEALVARPCWLAAHVQADELDSVLKAQRGISRSSPRILLILVPANPGDAADFLGICRREGFHVALWDDGVFPSENTDILLAENAAELGLFYRIAPITLLASSLKPGHKGRNPFDPAALGSAVLYGPSVYDHLPAYTRLANAKAARVVTSTHAIVTTLEDLMAPDKVALMVHAGWDTVSAGAGVVSQIIQDIRVAVGESENAPEEPEQ